MTAIIEPIIVEINHNSRKLCRIHNKEIIAKKAKIYNIANKESFAIKKKSIKIQLHQEKRKSLDANAVVLARDKVY
jgi:hypothetical protein